MHQPRSLDHYRLLGRSGLRVWPLSLGTMTFGQAWGWGADAGEAKRIFDAYANRGGNVINTALNSTNGGSERILGALTRDRRERFDAADVSSSRKGVIASTGHLNARSLEIARWSVRSPTHWAHRARRWRWPGPCATRPWCRR